MTTMITKNQMMRMRMRMKMKKQKVKKMSMRLSHSYKKMFCALFKTNCQYSRVE